jgi:hypothetical protein
MFEHRIYTDRMFAHEAGQALVAKLRGPSRQRVRERAIPTEEAAVVTEFIHTTAGKASPIAQDMGPTPRYRVNGSSSPHRELAEPFIQATTDQELVPLRRVDGAQPPPYEILGPMESPGPASNSDAAASPGGVSAFIARVLDQLTLSAWLPAALLTASVAILLQFRSDRSANILTAIRALTADPVRVLVLIVPLLVIATVVTQAFSFEAITTLEGYWRRRGPANLARTLMIRRHVRRKKAIEKRRMRATERAFYVAEPRMLREGIPFPIVNAMKAEALELEEPHLTDEERERLDKMNWRKWSDAWLISQIEHLIKEGDASPRATHRVLPTRLGNLMRATEDELRNTGGDVEGFALRRYAMAPSLVQNQHDQFRNRLEMYCTLVFVSSSLLILTPIILLGSGIGSAAIGVIAVGFVALSEASYLAAIASARGYCSALREMDKDTPSTDTADEARQLSDIGI